MADRREISSSTHQLRSPSFSQPSLVTPFVATTAASASSPRPATSFASVLPSLAKPKIGSIPQQRSATASPSVFAMSSKLDQNAWSDASAANTGNPSSVWNGRGRGRGRAPSTMDADAVSTPARGPTALDAKEAVSGNATVFTPSPLLPQDGSAWSIQRPASLTWANDLATRPPPVDLISESAASSPNAVKRVAVKDPPAALAAGTNASSPSGGAPKPDSVAAATSATSAATIASTSPSSNKDPTSKPKPAAPVPKRAPIRSVTLDPSHLAGKRRLSDEIDDDPLPSGEPAPAADDDDDDDQELVDGVGTLTIATDNVAGSGADAAAQQQGYHSPPAFMHRPSGSFPPPPFSPGEAFMHPSPYLSASGARSPDGYTHGYPGVTHMLPGMAPIDMSGYESYRTTPDPYAPTMPGRAIFASPGSQGSTPQSPSFGPAPLGPHFNASMRNGEALFYPGLVPGFAPPPPPPPMAGGMASCPVRPGMPPGSAQYGFGPGPAAAGVDVRSSQLAQSPMIAPGMPMPIGGMMLPPTSPSMTTGGGPDSRGSPALSQSSPYSQGPHRRMGSSGAGGEPFGPGMAMSPRPPFAMPNQGGPFIPGQHHPHHMMGGGPMMAWNGRFHDHRRVPTGPGGVMAPVGGYGIAPGGVGPMDPHFARNGSGFYSAPPFHPSHNAAGPGGHHHHHHHHHNNNNNNSSNGTVSGNHTSHSPLLEEFRSRHAKNRKFELPDIYGSIVEFSSDQHGSRFIQEKLDTASTEEKKTVFDEILPHAHQLMTDVFGNYVIQKMLEHGDDLQRDVLSREMEGQVFSLSLGTYGCRVVQKAFDHISSLRREKLAKELDGHIMQCVRDQNANHVVQKVIETVDSDKIDFIPNAFLGNVSSLASHCYSCRVLQRCFEYCDEKQTRPLLEELHKEAYGLMQHQYGNYVIQWVLQRGQIKDRKEVVGKIKGSILTLSRHKFASNVVEQVIRTSSLEDREELLEEILCPIFISNDNLDAFKGGGGVVPAVLMMKDQFANYVVQRFLESANSDQRRKLIDVIQPSLIAVRKGNLVHTKHLVAIERLIDNLIADQTSSAGVGITTVDG